MSDYSVLEYVKLAIYYASWLYFPVAIFLVTRLMNKAERRKRLALSVLAILSVLAYARFVEPRILLTRRHEIALERCFAEAGALKLAVFSDTHIGLFANAMPPTRIAKAVAAASPDAVLIAGDFTYFLGPDRFEKIFAPLSGIAAPVYLALGNHDVGLPGPDVGVALKASLARLNLIDIENRGVRLSNRRVEIVGLSDTWQRRQDMRVVTAPAAIPRIVLTHNPETAFDFPDSAVVDLLIAGHTHGGQIYIPLITCRMLSIACSPHRLGLKKVNGRQVFITAGTGMVGLPMRFMVPPRIDVLDIRFESCISEGATG